MPRPTLILLCALLLTPAARGQDPPAPAPQPAPAATIGDVIRALVTADDAAKTAADQAAKANQALTDALAGQKDARAEARKDLAVTGPVFVQEADGGFSVYIPDTSDDGFHVIRPVPVTTPLNPAPVNP